MSRDPREVQLSYAERKIEKHCHHRPRRRKVRLSSGHPGVGIPRTLPCGSSPNRTRFAGLRFGMRLRRRVRRLIKMLGGNKFRLRQGFALGKTLVRATRRAPLCGAPGGLA